MLLLFLINMEFQSQVQEHEKIKEELYNYKQQKIKEQSKVNDFSDKIDELNQ